MTLATVDGAFDRYEIDSLSPDAIARANAPLPRTVLVSIDRDDVRSMD